MFPFPHPNRLRFAGAVHAVLLARASVSFANSARQSCAMDTGVTARPTFH